MFDNSDVWIFFLDFYAKKLDNEVGKSVLLLNLYWQHCITHHYYFFIIVLMFTSHARHTYIALVQSPLGQN